MSLVVQALQGVDWSRPWLAPWRACGLRVAQRVLQGSAVHVALNQELGAAVQDVPVRFVAHDTLPAGLAYEQFIFDTAQVPTRDNLHDFFNGLAWLQFPQVKTRLNRLQAAQIALDGVQDRRGPVRDTLTVLDENAAFLCAPAPLCQALQAKDWPRLFGVLRPLWAQAQLQLFGHALLEKLVQPRKPIVAHVITAWGATENVADQDKTVARWLETATLAAKPFAPLPVLGVPGWWADNEAPGFYADTAVFRLPTP